VLEEVPYIGPIATVLKYVFAVLLVIGILEIVHAMYESIHASHSNMMVTVGPTGTFAGLQVDPSGKMIKLTDVRVDWDDADVNDIAARANHGG
jgi:hypothetical protein